MKHKELVFKILPFFIRPFSNKITLHIVVAGIGLTGTPLWELLLEALFESELDIIALCC